MMGPHEEKKNGLKYSKWGGDLLGMLPICLPIKTLFLMNTHGVGMFQHTLIVAGAGSKVTYIEEYCSSSFNTQTISNCAVEIFLDEGAIVNYVGLQNGETL